ncbi:MAG: DUF4342 domain-containing protein [Eubacteriales bacterium]|jgi:hypothetical protein|nr:DUF4342 domain-containing protein [Eubacteriales bacterium]MDD4106306.1 DUF4342 domain-containing protein [Eubacteriales bacterium]MDD4711433.1 DUF4342 domain-containing protein [Eubacteriales bacterium]NLO15986.1 DUF4342 domain-containing protein [Clostridiales bacterium]
MDHFEMVEKLRDKANVSYEEAKAALEASEWDLLDALVYLENKGRIRKEDEFSYTTRHAPKPQKLHEEKESAKGIIARLLNAAVRLINRGNKIIFEVSRKEKKVLELPLTVVVLLMIVGFWFFIWTLLIGLFFGLRYNVRGEGISDSVNRVMDKAADTAENIKSGVTVEINSSKDEQDKHNE